MRTIASFIIHYLGWQAEKLKEVKRFGLSLCKVTGAKLCTLFGQEDHSGLA
jgi:hypothetical protein